jgi:hypothetical protein
MLDWTRLSEFRNLDLIESYVLKWSHEQDLVFDVEFFILPGHSRYRVPSSEQFGCYLRGCLRFPNPQRVSGLRPLSSVRPATDASGEHDYGNFDDFALGPDGYVLIGEFGSVTVVGDPPSVDLLEPL